MNTCRECERRNIQNRHPYDAVRLAKDGRTYANESEARKADRRR